MQYKLQDSWLSFTVLVTQLFNFVETKKKNEEWDLDWDKVTEIKKKMIIGAINRSKKTHPVKCPWSLFPDWHSSASSFFWRPRVSTCECEEISPAEDAEKILETNFWWSNMKFSRKHKNKTPVNTPSLSNNSVI